MSSRTVLQPATQLEVACRAIARLMCPSDGFIHYPYNGDETNTREPTYNEAVSDITDRVGDCDQDSGLDDVRVVFDIDIGYCIYRNGVWDKVPDIHIEQEITKFDYIEYGTLRRDKTKRRLSISKSFIIAAAWVLSRRIAKFKYFEVVKHSFNFLNQNITAGNQGLESRPPSPNNRCLCGIDENTPDYLTVGVHEHNPLGEFWTEKIPSLEYVRRIVDDSEDVKSIQEFLGMSLLGAAPMGKKMLLFFGETWSGNGTLSRIMAAALPQEYVYEGRPPWEFRQSYELTGFINMLLHVHHDQDNIKDIKIANQWVSGEGVDMRHLGGETFGYKPKAGTILNMNGFVTMDKNSDLGGIFRRSLVVRCSNSNLHKEGTSQDLILEEVSQDRLGWLCWALAGAERWYHQNDYTESASSRAEVESWKDLAQPERAWIRKHMVVDEESEPSLQAEYYKAWVSKRQDGGMPYKVAAKRSKQAFNTTVKLLLVGARGKRHKSGQQWVNVRYRTHVELKALKSGVSMTGLSRGNNSKV